MEKIKQFLKNKSIGYFVLAGIAFFSLVLAIIFFATFKNPAFNGPNNTPPMGNKADGMVAETIGIFLLAAFVVELVVLALPQYRFVHVIAILLFGLALYKDVCIIPDFIVGKLNNVEYNGGNFGLNMFIFIALLLLAIASVVVAFLGFYVEEEEARKEMPIVGKMKVIVVAVCTVVVAAAVLSSSIVSSSLQNKSSRGNGGNNSSQVTPTPKVDPITDEIRAAAAANDYSFDPNSVVIQQQESYNFSNSDLSALSYSATRSGHNLVYVFEGEYSEGYQGQYNTYSTGMYLWDDGLFAGKSNSTNFKGYWYNSSLTAGTDENGQPVVDCLNMVSDTSHFESIIAEVPLGGASDFYERQAYVYMHPGWGDGRSVVVSGYKYYPDVAAFIDTNDNTEMKVGDKFVVNSTWFYDKVIKNLKYTQIIPTSEITWTLPDGMIDSSKKLLAAGEYEITAKWKSYTATATLKVTK